VSQPTDPLSSAYAAYEQFESKLSTAMDQLVATNGFAELFTTSATTMMALTRIANGVVDQAARATRLAVRGDVVNLGRQLARTEDKLERVLQAVEAIEDRLASLEAGSVSGPAGGGSASAAPARSGSAASSPASSASSAASAGSENGREPASAAPAGKATVRRPAKRSTVAAAAERSAIRSATGRAKPRASAASGRSRSKRDTGEGRS
jgi:hypothetical protein